MSDSLRSRLESELRTAMRARQSERRDAVRYLLANVKNAEIDQRGPLSADTEIALLRQQAKQRQEAIDQFSRAGRTELADREAAQLALIQDLLPQQMSDDELARFVAVGIEEAGAQSPKEIGKVMGLLSGRAEGRVDGRRLAEAVRRSLDS